MPMPSRVPRVRHPVAAAALAAGACLLALYLLVGGPAVRFEALVSSGLHAHTGDPLRAAIVAVTLIGGTQVAIPVTAACAAGLLALRLWHSAFALVAAVAVTQLVVQMAKHFFERPRPAANAAGTEAGGFSFPSGHAATSAALFGVLVLVASRHLQGRARHLAAAAGVAVVAAVGVSRVALAAHYPTDVLAGWVTGGAIALGCLALFTRARTVLARSIRAAA